MAENVRPEALAAGAVTMIVMAVLYNRSENVCVKFTHIWKEEGPIHLKQEIQNKAFARAAEKLRSANAAGIKLGNYDVQLDLAKYFEPKCDWSKLDSDRAKKIWLSFGDIARYSREKFNGENS